MDSHFNIFVNHEAIESLVKEWQTQRFQWSIYDTPMSQADNFQESMQYLFLGSLLHWGLDGIDEHGNFVRYINLGAEGSIGFWKAFRLYWPKLSSNKLSFPEFSEMFAGLHALPDHYQQWSAVTGVLRQKYGGEILPFLESCQWSVSTVQQRVAEEFPAFCGVDGQYSRLHLFLYLAQGKFASAKLFNGLERIQPYMDSVLLAGLIQTGVLEVPAGKCLITSDVLAELKKTAYTALSELALRWSEVSHQQILMADLNTPLRKHGVVSTWRSRFPINFA